MYLLLQIYMITVTFSMMVIFSLKLLIDSNESIRKKTTIIIEKGKENGVSNGSGDVFYMWYVMIPVINVAMSCFFIWIIFADEENIKKLLEDRYNEH